MILGEYFSINIFFILFRETLECVIIVSVLLAFLEQNASKTKNNTSSSQDPSSSNGEYEDADALSLNEANSTAEAAMLRKLRLQVWLGAFSGVVVCLLIGGLFILTFYALKIDLWAKSEHYWEAVFSIAASIIISIMGFGMLQLNKLERKWHAKLGHILSAVSQSDDMMVRASSRYLYADSGASFIDKLKHRAWMWNRGAKRFASRNILFILPFVTTLRECLESILFIGGIGVTEEASTYLLSIILGIAVGTAIGLFVYHSGTSSVSSQRFMVYSTALLYILAAGLMAKGIWQLELQKFIDKCGGLDVSEVGSGPGSYDIDNSVWHVNCCNGEADGPWMIATAIFGWTNSATYGSVTAYIVYWLVVSGVFHCIKYENKHGYYPILPIRWQLKKIKKNFALENNLKKDNGLTGINSGGSRPSEDSTSRLL
ncbi:Fth1 protein [Saccharomycopsis crataegensis]|uniref:Fth1 protein n=1 Tax=Saccharomycopsis crataegensis TaxID=43959 RepID=A0AAV5QRS8_9ASCO|nr:Fth1 protein [Saccharomycopsis crataegensis]